MQGSFSFSESVKNNLTVYDCRYKPFKIYGLLKPQEPGVFKRMPKEVADSTNHRVSHLYTNTAGGRLRFMTDSTVLAVGAVYAPTVFTSARTAALSGPNSFFFDLYADGEHQHVLWPEGEICDDYSVHFELSKGHYESVARFSDKRMREIILCFPSFVNVSEVYIGVNQDAVVKEATPYRNEGNPVVFYGSSITQGACASRSGNLYQNILSRKLNMDYINLGFASGCKAESAMIDYLCTLSMPMLVFDYDHNAPSVDFLEKTHLSALRKLRKAHPHVPFVLMSKPNVHSGREEAILRAAVIEKSYQALKTESDAPIYFINGQDIWSSHDSEMMTVDGTHPTDLGFHCIAEALIPCMKPYFN